MPRTRFAFALSCLVLSAAPVSAASAAQALVTNDGRRVTGELKAVTTDGRVSFAEADGKVTTRALDEIAALELNDAAPPGIAPSAEAWLPAGGTLRGEIAAPAAGAGAGDADGLTFKCEFGEVRLPLSGLRAIRYPGNTPAAEDIRKTFEEAFERSRADAARTDDVIFARRGDDFVQLGGFLTGVSPTTFTFRYQGAERKLAVAKVYAVVLSGRAAGAAATPETVAKVTGVAGSSLTVEAREFRDGKWRLLGPGGLDLSAPAASVSRMEFRSGKIIYLSALPRKPDAVRSAQSLGGDWPVLDDRNYFGEPLRVAGKEVRGLCCKPRTEIRYDLTALGGELRRFNAILGIDDAAAPAKGRATFEVLLDGKSAYKAENVAAGDAREMGIDIAGAKVLVLRVDFAGGSGVGEIAVWGDARLIRK
jgi:hypothetical protein